MTIRIEAEFNRRLPIETLFQFPTISGLARALQPGADPPLVKLWAMQANGNLPPFICVEASLFMRTLAQRLGTGRLFLSLLFIGPLGIPPTPATRRCRSLAHPVHSQNATRRALLSRRLVQVGVLAYEIARQLRAMGHPVPLLVLFDS